MIFFMKYLFYSINIEYIYSNENFQKLCLYFQFLSYPYYLVIFFIFQCCFIALKIFNFKLFIIIPSQFCMLTCLLWPCYISFYKHIICYITSISTLFRIFTWMIMSSVRKYMTLHLFFPLYFCTL